jgi:hypothetical protein
MGNETYIKKINNLLSKKTYHYESEIYSFDYILELTGEIKPLISIGEWKDFYLLNFKIFNLNDTAKRIMSFIIKEHPEYQTEDKEIYDIKKPLRQLGIERSLGGMARKMLRTLNIKETITKEVLVSLSELEGDYEEFKLNIDESSTSISSGEYTGPLELGLIKWENKTLAPFSDFVDTEFNHKKIQKTVKNNVKRVVGVWEKNKDGSYKTNQHDVHTINEGMIDRLAVRTVVKDIVNIIKQNDEGEFYLPEDVNDELEYTLTRKNISFSVELTLRHNDIIGGFGVNGAYSHSDDTIEIVIEYNPETINSQLYDLIGEINEVVTHEMVHLDQNYKGELHYPDLDDGPLEYYTRKHEVPAQYYGFKRLSKLRNVPLEDVVREWFRTHKKTHKLKPEEEDIVIDTILNYKP